MLDCQVKLSGKKLGQGYQSLGEEQKVKGRSSSVSRSRENQEGKLMAEHSDG